MPWSVRFGTSASLLRLRLRGALLLRNRSDARDGPTDHAHTRCIFELARRPLKAQIELLLLELQGLVVELVDRHGPESVGFHHAGPPVALTRRCARRSAS